MNSMLKQFIYGLLILSSLLFMISAQANANTATHNAVMTPPQPIANKVFEGMVGSWSGNSEMMGQRMGETLKVSWSLNHQFLIMQLKAKSIENPKMNYEGLGVFGIDHNGKVKTWWFDSWGADAVSTGTGEINGNKVTISDGNHMFKEVRSFELQGNQMIMRAEGTMNAEGKPMPYDTTTVYNK